MNESKPFKQIPLQVRWMVEIRKKLSQGRGRKLTERRAGEGFKGGAGRAFHHLVLGLKGSELGAQGSSIWCGTIYMIIGPGLTFLNYKWTGPRLDCSRLDLESVVCIFGDCEPPVIG